MLEVVLWWSAAVILLAGGHHSRRSRTFLAGLVLVAAFTISAGAGDAGFLEIGGLVVGLILIGPEPASSDQP